MSISPTLTHALLAVCLLAATGCSGEQSRMQVADGVPERGRMLIQSYGCAACHTIPGIPSHGTNVGPPLSHISQRAYLAGLLPHTVDNMVAWLRDPPAVDPATAMPNLGVSAAEARDIAAYLYSTD